MRQGLHISQSLRLTQTLTPQMRMNLELIQAPILEAVQSLDQEVMTNPWLERNEDATDPRFIRDADQTPQQTQTPRQQVQAAEDDSWYDPVAATPWTHEEFPADEAPGQVAVHMPSPYEQLEAQIREVDLTRDVQDLALVLVQNLDEHGYLPFSEEDLLKAFGLEADALPKLKEAIRVIQYELEPPGLAARNQSHSFLIQLERQGKDDSLAARLIREEVLQDIKPRNLDAVAKKIGVTQAELHSALEDLHRLSGNPMNALDRSVEPTLYPDLIVEKVDGEWQVFLSHPLSGRYRYRDTRITKKSVVESIDGGEEDPAEVLRRLRAMRQDARMMVRATEYRDRTLYEIGNQLVKEQQEFLERGEEALKPLLQKELAERLGLNEATVSRILKEKHMRTPRGQIPLSAFFSRSITNKKGEKIANKAVMEELSRLVTEEEDPAHPWSDQEISKILSQRGFPISRRTVTKYRQILNIGAAGDRKAQRKIQEAR